MIVQVDVKTGAPTDFVDVTTEINQAVVDSGVQQGTCHLFVPHTTAAITLNENWDPDVRGDLVRALAAMVPNVSFRHGEGNSPAHLMSTLVGTSEMLLIDGGRLLLGSWQGVYLAEFDGPRRRRLFVKIVPDAG